VTAGAVRIAVIVVCAGGIVGMIVASVADNDAVALTFGLLTAAAVACLIVATAVTAAAPATAPSDTDERAERVETMVRALVASGADEAAVRALVREVVHLDELRLGAKLPGRGARRTHP
jgi:hypothetical protein